MRELAYAEVKTLVLSGITKKSLKGSLSLCQEEKLNKNNFSSKEKPDPL